MSPAESTAGGENGEHMKKTAPKFHEEATRRAVAVRASISPDDLSLIVNALRAKSAGDLEASRGPWGANTTGAELARTLREQAEQGEQLADALEGVDTCEAIEVRS